ncbi:hypothetical protein ABZ897_25935 [Nonomuraea sp. NPDC046802]|uniref:hypothetical protein n=1 Tax=Nonomuraea sp. NPDC046802 TaxID=3154919 RepID=UPI0033E227B7
MTAKAAVVAVLSAAMQIVLFVTVIGVGKLVFGLPGMPQGQYVAISALIMLACVPVAVLQSALSMLMRSFAAPIAVAFVGAGVSVVLLMAGPNVAIVFPYALIGRATQLGTGTFSDSGIVTARDVASIVLTAAIVTGGLISATTAVLDRRDARV